MTMRTALPLPWRFDGLLSIIAANGEVVATDLYNEDAEAIIVAMNIAWETDAVESGGVALDDDGS